MALVRCLKDPSQGRTKTYAEHVQPVRYPNTAAICGNVTCDDPEHVWLERSELERCKAGNTVFELPTNAATVAVEPSRA